MQVITIGIDLAKHVFQVNGVNAEDKVVFNKPLRRSQVEPCRQGAWLKRSDK